jgi:hypothetical protein
MTHEPGTPPARQNPRMSQGQVWAIIIGILAVIVIALIAVVVS